MHKIKVCQESKADNHFIHADCLPALRKDRVYKLILKLVSSSFEMVLLSVDVFLVDVLELFAIAHSSTVLLAVEEFGRP